MYIISPLKSLLALFFPLPASAVWGQTVDVWVQDMQRGERREERTAEHHCAFFTFLLHGHAALGPLEIHFHSSGLLMLLSSNLFSTRNTCTQPGCLQRSQLQGCGYIRFIAPWKGESRGGTEANKTFIFNVLLRKTLVKYFAFTNFLSTSEDIENIQFSTSPIQENITHSQCLSS